MTECSKCGDCCERIWIAQDPDKVAQWAYLPEYPPTAARSARANSNIEDARFIHKYWLYSGDGFWQCSKWDSESRLCTAHDERPPVCRNYPWYGERPSEDRGRSLPERCAFRADVKNLPIVSINGK